jgi:hypothetical protein
MKAAVLRIPSSNNVRFEVHSTPSRGHTNIQKWFIKANHPVEAARWTQAIGRAVEHAKNDKSTLSVSDSFSAGNSPNLSGSAPSSLRTSPQIPFKMRSDAESISSSHVDEEEANGSRLLDPHGLHAEREESSATDRGDEESGEWNVEQLDAVSPPHEGAFALNASSATAQLDLTLRLLKEFLTPGKSSVHSAELQKTVEESMTGMQTMVGEFVHMAKERDEWWRARLAREQKRQTMWEQSLQSVVQEGEVLERELREQARAHRRSRTGDATESNYPTLRGRPSIFLHSPPALPEDTESPLGSTAAATAASAVAVSPPSQVSGLPDATASSTSSLTLTPVDGPKRRQLSLSASTLHRPKTFKPAELSPPLTAGTIVPDGPGATAFAAAIALDDDAVDTDDEDEFFDAIEANALPSLVISEALEKHTPALSALMRAEQYSGYRVPRQKLPVTSDNRPPTSLWSVLKHSIGKDLTKISFPVFFNEPTSMLQRMAEDMEFSECRASSSDFILV